MNFSSLLEEDNAVYPVLRRIYDVVMSGSVDQLDQGHRTVREIVFLHLNKFQFIYQNILSNFSNI